MTVNPVSNSGLRPLHTIPPVRRFDLAVLFQRGRGCRDDILAENRFTRLSPEDSRVISFDGQLAGTACQPVLHCVT
jgi:hypothetical protein